ncbi:hypothetical protein C2845_PM14G05300 [Panicum miliaceum]|uniref:F-box domain-containing protein n=1 Tax=Panicum miliaceum TaxID=4540 RepID=A0A3L6PLJ8_PANMI|nr:hypothetical protein C2845_PM14G05300 [Panicum miliaceum]
MSRSTVRQCRRTCRRDGESTTTKTSTSTGYMTNIGSAVAVSPTAVVGEDPVAGDVDVVDNVEIVDGENDNEIADVNLMGTPPTRVVDEERWCCVSVSSVRTWFATQGKRQTGKSQLLDADPWPCDRIPTPIDIDTNSGTKTESGFPTFLDVHTTYNTSRHQAGLPPREGEKNLLLIVMASEAASTDHTDRLNDDLVAEILLRLPSAAVLRSRAVCRAWRRVPTRHQPGLRRRPLELVLQGPGGMPL